VAVWLFVTAFLVFCMVVVGGATRLTGSGLSITEWKPVTGVIPPLSEHGWLVEFQKYQRIPQYRFVNRDMTLAGFQGIYWWEWTHRLLGRLLGVVFGLPFVIFLILRRIPARLIWRCVTLFGLGGLQGLVGWWMVKSGLEGRVSVAPERLATHLGLALILYAGLIWTGWEAWAGAARPDHRPRWSAAGAALAVMALIQSLLGALVAGNQAGLVDNDWPLMNRAVIPIDYWAGGLWRTLIHSQAAVQFNHRLGGYVLLAMAIAFAVGALRSRRLAAQTKALFVVAAVLVTCQAALGVTTLMLHAPLGLSVLHQAGAAIVLGLAVTLAWRSQRA
jgi:cytochrome c oxidase assembly protein subunit 15